MGSPSTSGDVARVWSATTVGIDAVAVELEVHVRTGLPSYTVVGLPQASVRESRDRVLSALRVSGLPVPRGAVTVNLAPADLRKEGSLFDLPLAVGLLAAQQAIPAGSRLDGTSVVGELALDGRVRPGRGILAVVMSAVERGAATVIVPHENAAEASLVRGIRVHAVDTLEEAVRVLRGQSSGVAWKRADVRPAPSVGDLEDVVGQAEARRALEVSAAGRHHLLFTGPPGAGKTMLARRLPTILPSLEPDEALEVTRVQSAAGLTTGAGLAQHRPFRAPHHSVTLAGLIGGGDPPRPGELALAHHGVLFLDELPEFGRPMLESLRQPLEDGFYVLARARWRVRLPSRVILAAGMNPCPCGRLGQGDDCTCDQGLVRRYLGRVSGPILDRTDLQVTVRPVPAAAWDAGRGEASSVVAARVMAAQDARKARGQGPANGLLDAAGIRHWCGVEGPAASLLRGAVEGHLLSARAVARIRTVARTLADLDGTPAIKAEHVAEAVQFRRQGCAGPTADAGRPARSP